MRPVYYLSAFIPIAVALDVASASAPLIFFASAIGVIPTAALMSDATEQLAARAGPGIGGLLNVTFSRPPMPGPDLAARCSVASPMSAAVGITPIAEAKNVSGADAFTTSSRIATGMKAVR